MGCAQSKIENEETVARCKLRKQYMTEAVAARNAFAAAHSAYAMSLKNAGAALSDYGHCEAGEPSASSSSVAAAATAAHASPSSSSAAHSSIATPQPPVENLPPPPPPLPDFSPSPLQRSASMPDFAIPKPKKPPTDPTIREEDDDDEAAIHETEAEPEIRHEPSPSPPLRPSHPSSAQPPPMPMNEQPGPWEYFFAMDPAIPGPSLGSTEEILPERREINEDRPKKHTDKPPAPAKPPQKIVEEPATPPLPPKQVKMVHHQHAVSSGSMLDSKKGKMVAVAQRTISLLQVLDELDDHFLRASQSAHEVSNMLEAARMHYHSNFADDRVHIDHSARVLRVITWNRSIKGLTNLDDAKDDFDDEKWETHATVLDKMLAWEKKLYDEVKAGELLKIEYQRKVASLTKQKKHGAPPETLEKTKAIVSQLHTRYIVDMQSMDSTVSEINHLRDDKLYPRLVLLVDGMAKMWETMHTHHLSQQKIVSDLRGLDVSNAPKETTEQHYDRTVQLFKVVGQWQTQFQKLVTHQKEYIQALNSWLSKNLIPIESNLKEKVSSPPRFPQPPIQNLLRAWHDRLERLPSELAKGAITSIANVINTIVTSQQEELKQREKCEDLRKEYLRKVRAFDEWYRKYSEKRMGMSEEATNDGESGEGGTHKDLVAERKFAVEALKTKVDEEVERYHVLCRQVREKSYGSLKTHLPELFRSLAEFAKECSMMYKNVRATTQPEQSGYPSPQ